MFTCMWMYMGECTCPNVSVDARHWPQLSFLRVNLPYFWKQDLSPSWDSSSRLGWLVTECKEASHLWYLSTGIINACYLAKIFICVLGIKLRSSCLHGKYTTHWAISSRQMEAVLVCIHPVAFSCHKCKRKPPSSLNFCSRAKDISSYGSHLTGQWHPK